MWSQRICCLDLDLVFKPLHLHHDTRLGRVNAAKMSNELMDKEIIILIQGSLLRLPLRFFQFAYRPWLRLLFILLRLRTALDRDANSINIWNKMGMLNPAARVSPPATKVMGLLPMYSKFSCKWHNHLDKIDFPAGSPISAACSGVGIEPLAG
jgi:hypothetical protein